MICVLFVTAVYLEISEKFENRLFPALPQVLLHHYYTN